MTATLEQLEIWMRNPENERLEFKEARESYQLDKLVRYCVALANEGGGKLILGVTDRIPRQVIGTKAFQDLEITKAHVVGQLRMRVDTTILAHPDGRVIVFDIPSCPIGVPLSHNGAFLMRAGEGLVAMTTDRIRQILGEAELDFSAEICPSITLNDLSSKAIQEFRHRWRQKLSNDSLDTLTDEQLLFDAELVTDYGVTYAALVLLGTREALGKHLAQAEVIFEYRNSESSIRFQQREEYREAFLLFYDQLWGTTNLRNDMHQYQDGLFVWDIPTFNEEAVREAILNAVAHRDYRRKGSVFIRQYPSRLIVESPGGFPLGITVENILSRQQPRNRRLAEALTRCGLVERSGQGMNLMFDRSIREGKLPPDFSGTDDYQVNLTLRGDVQDARFLRFLERIGNETHQTFSIEDLILLDRVHREHEIPSALRDRIPRLRDLGIIESQGKGRGARNLLSRRFYDFTGEKGTYTQRLGLDRETNKALLVKHIDGNKSLGSQFNEFRQVLPALSRDELQSLLKDLKAQGEIHAIGNTRAARWYPGPSADWVANPDIKTQ